ncbi:MAG: SoxR reducing system RseC family protein [Prevotella sp.]|nr:SoxR reducing system RseC family protein [Prevotella sp.]
MNNTITHSGVIEKIDQNQITVRIEQVSGCASCKVAGQCNASERKEKRVEVCCDNPAIHRVGETVVVSADAKVGRRAVVWGFGLPLILLLVCILGIKAWTGNDGLAALVAMLSLACYYAILYLLRQKIRDKLTFEIS